MLRGPVAVPYGTWDDRVRAFRAQALYYREIKEYLERSNLAYHDSVQDLVPAPLLKGRTRLRGYQEEAILAWGRAGKRGIIVLPTGSGKTVVAMRAIEMVNLSAIIILPTLDLLEQWRQWLHREFGTDVGVVGGGEHSLKALTVATYDSAYLKASEIGNRFAFVIFDEVHHLAAEGYKLIAEMFTAPFRMGLTATYEREDMLHRELPRLTGGVVYQLQSADLAGTYLSNYVLERTNIKLKDEEKEEYDRNYRIYRDYLEENGIRIMSPVAFQHFIMRSTRDREARRALLARNRALDIAANSEAKIEALESILAENPNEKTLIFTQYNDLVYRISRRFLIPFITHTTTTEERHEVLQGFKEDRFRAIATSRVLNEGIDVPEASLGVIVSGTGSSREFIQRLGRLLRKKKDTEKRARLIELVSTATTETRTSSRRKRAIGSGHPKDGLSESEGE